MAPAAKSSTERQPLLQQNDDAARQASYGSSVTGASNNDDNPSTKNNVEDQQAYTPLPKTQLFVLCLLRISEPLCFTLIFPFVNEQIHELLPHVPKAQIGYYAGLIESLFAITQVFTVFLWGSLSDRIGRKPVLLIGLAGTFVSISAFGLARSFPAMIAARCVSGLFNANISVLKSMLGELTDSTNQARAFSLLPMMFAIGTIVGPWLGGTLSHPAETYPGTIVDNEFFKKYPYYLPCGLASLYVIFAMIIGSLFLNETLASKVRKAEAQQLRSHATQEEQDNLLSQEEQREATHLEEAGEEEQARRPAMRSLLTGQVLKILTTQMILNLQNISYTSLIPLFCFEPVVNGGVGFTRSDIGHLLAANGILAILTQSIVFPALSKRLGGPLATYRFALLLAIPPFMAFPVAHYVAQTFGYKPTWIVFGVGVTFKALSGMAIVCATLLVNNASPSRSTLGALNGLSQMFGSASRAIGPTMSTSLFAFSSTHKGLGWLVWIVMIMIALGALALSSRIDPEVNEPVWQKNQERERQEEREREGEQSSQSRVQS